MANDAMKVTAGQPKVGGAVFWAPTGTVLPANALSTLDVAYECLGYVSEDGVTFSKERDTEDIVAWGGDKVLNIQTEKTDTVQMTLIEALNEWVLKVVHGVDNVSGNLSDGLTVRENSASLDYGVWVIDMVLNGNVLKRTVIPNAKITTVDDVQYSDSAAVGYTVTASAFPYGDWSGDTHREYMAYGSETEYLGTLTVTSEAGATAGKTKITVAEPKAGTDVYKYIVANTAISVTYGMDVTSWTTWNGTDEITATSDKVITVVEATATFEAVKVGRATVVSA